MYNASMKVHVFDNIKCFDILPASVKENTLDQLLNQVLTFLGLIGVIVDPTTTCLAVSDRAMGYDEPWDDNANN